MDAIRSDRQATKGRMKRGKFRLIVRRVKGVHWEIGEIIDFGNLLIPGLLWS